VGWFTKSKPTPPSEPWLKGRDVNAVNARTLAELKRMGANGRRALRKLKGRGK
jgi:hypothetical protein